MVRRNVSRNGEARERGVAPAIAGESGSAQMPEMYNYWRNNRTTPPDPLVTEDPVEIERSILGHSGLLGETLTDAIYSPAFLASQIGKDVKVEFLINSNMVVKSGELIAVGVSYVLLRSHETGEVVMGDLYTIKFVTIYNNVEH